MWLKIKNILINLDAVNEIHIHQDSIDFHYGVADIATFERGEDLSEEEFDILKEFLQSRFEGYRVK